MSSLNIPNYVRTPASSYANELGRQSQCIGSGPTPGSQQVAGTSTFVIIDFYNIPSHKRKEICHTKAVCELRPDKDSPDRTCITIIRNRICYPGDVGTNMASLELVKLFLSSVLSRNSAQFSIIDLKNFYLDMPMHDPEYVQIKISDILEEFIKECNLKGHDRDVIYFEICCGCYGLLQSGILANDFCWSFLIYKGYYTLPPCRASGATSGGTSNSASLLTTLVWNTLASNTSAIC